MKKIKRYAIFFAVGAVGYAVIELLWRGHTHWSMLIAGGLCFVIFSVVCDKLPHSPTLVKAAICAAAITTVEFVLGLIFNIALGMNVWSYADVPFNVMGQICPTFTLLWVLLSLLVMPLADYMNKRLTKKRYSLDTAAK